MTPAQAAGPQDLYASCYSRLVRVITLACGSVVEAEDAVQEAFVRLIPRWGSVAEHDDPEAWLRMVALRLCRSRLRRAQRQVAAVARLRRERRVESSEPSIDSMDVAAALKKLPTFQREVVVLHYVVGLPVEEIGRALAIPPGTVKSRLARAREALGTLLGEEMHDRA